MHETLCIVEELLHVVHTVMELFQFPRHGFPRFVVEVVVCLCLLEKLPEFVECTQHLGEFAIVRRVTCPKGRCLLPA